jgi:hypothetical protein
LWKSLSGRADQKPTPNMLVERGDTVAHDCGGKPHVPSGGGKAAKLDGAGQNANVVAQDIF